MKIVLHGYYGVDNIGDDLMMMIACSKFREIYPDSSITVMLIGGDVDLINKSLPENIFIIHRPSIYSFIALMLKHDCYVWGGGTALHEFGFCGFYYNIVAKLLGKKVYWLGLGMNRISSLKSRFKAAIAIRCCNWIVMRDAESYTLLGEQFPWFKHKSLGADLVWLSSEKIQCGATENPVEQDYLMVTWGGRLGREVGQSLNDLDQIDKSKADVLCEAIILFCDKVNQNKIMIVDMGPDQDEIINNYIYSILQQIKPEGIQVYRYKEMSTNKKLQILSGAAMVVSARLHPLMIAKILGVKSLGWNYASKIENFTKMLDHPSCLNDEDFTVERVFELLMFENENPAEVTIDISKIKKSANMNFDPIFNRS